MGGEKMYLPKNLIRRNKAMNKPFDVNDPEKEFNEYRDASQTLIRKKQEQVKLSEALKADSEAYRRLSVP